MIDILNVSMVYDNDVEALHDVSLSIKDGEFVFLVGESGSGKSTLLKLLMRELRPSSGTIVVNKRNIGRLHRRRVAEYRRSLGVVFQDYRLLPQRTVYENVAYAMEVTEVPTKRIRRKVPQALNQVGIPDKSKAYPNEISGGEQQRTAIARAIVNEPCIILADEPTGNLDPKNSDGIMQLLEEINNKGTTVVIATHDKEIVNRYKKRVVHLEHGKIVSDREEAGYDEAEVV